MKKAVSLYFLIFMNILWEVKNAFLWYMVKTNAYFTNILHR